MSVKLLEKLFPVSKEGNLRWVTLTAWYLVTNVFHIGLGNARFWDDWYQYANLSELEAIERNCPVDKCGKIPFVYIWEKPLLEFGPWTMHLFVILIFAISAFLFHLLLCGIRSISPWQSALATTLFLVLPINGARVSLVTVRASLMMLLLLVAANLLIRNRAKFLICGGLVLSYAAFLPSIRAFAFAVFVVRVAQDLERVNKITRRTWLVGLLLLLIALLHQFWLTDLRVEIGLAGPETGYNTIKLSFMVRAVLVCGALATPSVFKLILHITQHRRLEGFAPSALAVGLLLLSMATFPYMAVGHFANLSDWIEPFLPDNSDWSSRHQLLQGFGLSIILVALLQHVVPERRHMSAMLAVITSAVFSFSSFANYYVDALKQRDVIEQLRQLDSELEGIEVFRFDDQALDINARGRGIRDYEWQAIVSQALGREVRILEATLPVSECFAEPIGKIVEVSKISGRLRTLLLRSRIVQISTRDLVVCQESSAQS